MDKAHAAQFLVGIEISDYRIWLDDDLYPDRLTEMNLYVYFIVYWHLTKVNVSNRLKMAIRGLYGLGDKFSTSRSSRLRCV